MNKKIKVYLCGVSYQHELGENGAADGVKVYPSVSAMHKHCECSDSGCGIVECDLTLNHWAKNQDIKKMMETAIPVEELNKKLIEETKNKIAKLQQYLEKLEKEEDSRSQN